MRPRRRSRSRTRGSPYLSCSRQLQVHGPGFDSKQRLPGDVAADLLAGELISARAPACHPTRDVRGDEDVWRIPQRVAVGERLGVGDVERGANAPGLQG